ncbi:MAG TPA: ABC transporter ATP-binding protein [Hyphomicrobiaceae bacterium]|jgi:iron(III) transport system ATP-binding protein|nr:ABC transporter ATP-binding protein [Hyphomicrobiaceae bacterium]
MAPPPSLRVVETAPGRVVKDIGRLWQKRAAPDAAPTPHGGRAAATIAARLTFERIERRYGGSMALAGLSLDIAPAEVMCLLGPSGCGKTTLLRVAAGIERPTAGRVLINDHEVAGAARFVPPEKRNVGLMFQDFALFPHLSIVDNVAFGLKALPREDARRQAMAMLARVGLERYAADYPHILSGGEQQRVALARALLPRPAVMLMDEPFSGLDVQLRERLQEETLALLRETRATCLIVTHAPAEAIRLGDRIAVMRAGRLLQAGKAETLYRNPADLFVARLFSEINEIPMRVEGGALRTPVGVFAVPGLEEGDAAILCIRRRAIRLTGNGQGLPGRVLHARFLGDLALLEIAAQGFERPLSTLVREADVPPRGQEVSISVDPESVLVFPAEAPAEMTAN